MPTHFDETTQRSKRERARDLIRALLAKTVANGATEQEAAKAAAKASELMSMYDLSATDAQEVRDDIYGAMRRAYGNPEARRARHHEACDLMMDVAKTCGTQTYYSGNFIFFFGQKHDCEISHYMLDLFINCSEADWKVFRRGTYADTSIRGRKSFMRGFIHRMRDRLRELRIERRKSEERAAAAAPNSGALVVLKRELVADLYKQHAKKEGISSAGAARRVVDRSSSNYAAGRSSADRTNITTGVGGLRAAAISGAKR